MAKLSGLSRGLGMMAELAAAGSVVVVGLVVIGH
jgi:hypothetical protein